MLGDGSVVSTTIIVVVVVAVDCIEYRSYNREREREQWLLFSWTLLFPCCVMIVRILRLVTIIRVLLIHIRIAHYSWSYFACSS